VCDYLKLTPAICLPKFTQYATPQTVQCGLACF